MTQGVRFSDEDRRRALEIAAAEGVQAAADTIGWSQSAAAAAVGVRPSDISKAVAVQDAARRAHILEVGAEFDRLPHGHQTRIAAIRSDPVLAEVIRLCAAADLRQDEMNRLVNTVNRARSESDALAAVGAAHEEHAADIARAGKGSRPNGTSPWGRMNTAINNVLALDPIDVAAAIPNADVAARARGRLRDAAKALMAVEQAVGKRLW